MLDSAAIRMRAHPGRGLYESFYFRGTSADGGRAFWLKHNMLRYNGGEDVWLEGALILFDRAANRTTAVYSHEAVDGERFARMSEQARDWEHVALALNNGSTVQIGHSYLAGHIEGEGGKASWDLQLRLSGHGLVPYPHALMYRLPWPKTKVLTRDCHIDFTGEVTAGDQSFSGEFHGMNGHNWGTSHAHTYAYANCAQFRGRDHAYFDGFSARVPVAGGSAVTPLLSIGSLHTRGRWHHFNGLLRASGHPVKRLDDHGWQLELSNGTHRLEVDVDGASPAELPWIALHYEHPGRERSVVKSTKFANIKLRLVRRDGQIEDELFSDACELETLLPGNRPAGDGYFGIA